MPPCVCASIGQNGRGLIRGIVTFVCDDYYRLTNMWARDLRTFSGSLMGKTQKKQQRHNMRQIANVLAVDIFYWHIIYI